jgi:hypothetical protein
LYRYSKRAKTKRGEVNPVNREYILPDGVNVLRGYVKSGPARDPDAVGLSKLTSVWTHSLKAPGFNHRTYQVRKPGFKVYIFKFNLYRYA